jgi:ABC-type multidrug transport system fused ATPase/permease subunit
MKLLKKLNYIFPWKQKLRFLGLFFMMLLSTVLEFAGVSLILPFVNILVNPDTLQSSFWYPWFSRVTGSTTVTEVLLALSILMIIVYILKNAYLLLLVNVRVKFISGNQVRMGSRMIGYFMRKPYTYHLQHNTSEVVRSVTSDVSSMFGLISCLFTLISDGLTALALIIYLFSIDTMLTLILSCAIALCSALYFLLVKKRIRTAGQENRKIYAKMLRAVHQAVGGIKEVKVMGRETYFEECYTKYGEEYVERNRVYAVLSAIPNRLIETCCVCGVLGVIAFKIASGDNLVSVVPTLSAFAVACIKLLPSANSINGAINGISFQAPCVESIYDEIIESEQYEKRLALEAAEKLQKNGEIHVAPNSDVQLRHIEFTYPNMDKPVLQDINMTIPSGASIGIVGVTGAGKTTLVDIILGLLEPQKGSVCYGGMDIRQDYRQWQSRIGYIPQNIYMIDDSIRNNVALGVYEEKIDDAQVWQALEDAQLADFVRGLKEQLDTVIGERGVRISGGQRQRIGIARALYYNPEILFFDEATSSLDNETERNVMEAINSLSGRKTMIIVAHRLTTIEKCDKVYRVIDGGIEDASSAPDPAVRGHREQC